MFDQAISSTEFGVDKWEDLSRATVSSIRDDHGVEHILSRFEDGVWDLSPYFEQSNVPASMKVIVWPSDIPLDLIHDTKSIVYAWFKLGRPGYSAAIARTVFIAAVSAGPILRWLASHGVMAFDQIRPLHLATYMRVCQDDDQLRPRGLQTRFQIIDLAWTFRERLHRPLSQYPWGEGSFSNYCGARSGDGVALTHKGVGKTPVIPSTVQAAVFAHCESIFTQAHQLLDKRDDGELGPSSETMRDLRDACLYLLSITSGMRNEEVIGIEVGAGRTESRDGVEYCWITSVEHKTGKGRVEYLVPAMSLKALEVVERYSAPLRAALQIEASSLESALSTPMATDSRLRCIKRLAQVRSDANRLFLGVIYGKFNQITALSAIASRVAFLRLAVKVGVDWKLSPHQTRRTYARTFVESRMGRQSLVFLKWQFKHSSISMSQLYAANPDQDPALYEDILAEYFDIKKELLGNWGDSGSKLSGGAGRKIIEMRATTVASRESLVANTATQINIRATGHGWGIAQEGGCGGAGLYESTRCVDCKNSVIDDEHFDAWRGIYEQHREMLELDDLGPVATARVRRDFALATKVMMELGMPASTVADGGIEAAGGGL